MLVLTGVTLHFLDGAGVIRFYPGLLRQVMLSPGIGPVVQTYALGNERTGELARQRDRLEQREEAVAASEAALVETRAQVERDRQALALREKALQAAQTAAAIRRGAETAGAAEESALLEVQAVFAAMRPAQAGPILSELDDWTVIAILRGLDSRQAASVLTALPPERAAAVARSLLAGAPLADNPEEMPSYPSVR